MLINPASRQNVQKRLPMSSSAIETCSGSSEPLPGRVDFLHKSGMANGSPVSPTESMFTGPSSIDIDIRYVNEALRVGTSTNGP